MEARLEDMTTHMEKRDQEVWEEPTIYKVALLARVMVSQEARRVEVPKPQVVNGKSDAKELNNFLWKIEQYFEAIALRDEVAKVRTTTLYLVDTTTL